MSIPEYANAYAGLCVIHKCHLNEKDEVTEACRQAFLQLNEEQKKQVFCATSKEQRTRIDNIVSNALRGHCYQLPEGYTQAHVVKDLIALMVISGATIGRKENDPAIIFVVEKQLFWLCSQMKNRPS